MKIIDLESLTNKEIVLGYKAKFVNSKNVTIAYWEVKAGSKLPSHSHIHEQVSQVTEGEFELTVADKVFVLKPGKIAIIPSNTMHSGVAITNCKITDTFYPLRKDYV